MENLVALNSDGSFPSPIPATQAGQYPKIGVTSGHRLQVEAIVTAPSPSTATVTTFTGGTKTVAAAGTPEALVATSTKVGSVVIVPLRTNTNAVYVGVSSTNDTQHAEPPIVITAAEGEVIDLNLIYIDVVTNGEGVAYITTS